MSNLPARYITVHASATPPSMDIGKAEINQWHLNNGWSGIGYHYVIRRDGTVELGRPLHTIGAHVGNNNTGNIGICLVGGVTQRDVKIPEDNYTDEQYTTLNGLITQLHTKFPDAKLMGHNDFPGYKSRGCPCFNQHVYFEWLRSSWSSMYKPSDWTDHSKYDWHRSSPEAWKIPNSFYDAVDFGGTKE